MAGPTDIAMPPVPVIGAALRKTTERLARELASPAAAAPDWDDFEWRAAMAASAIHGISALLANRLRWRGPDFWDAFLAEQKQQGILREQRVAGLLARLGAAASQAQIPLVGLKGSALLPLGLYTCGERPMSDIDLLLRHEDFEATGRLVEALGYVAGFTTQRHQAFTPASVPADVAFGEHVDNPVKIELHGRITECLPAREIDITAQEFPAQPQAGLNPYPSTAALMRHLLLHAAGNMQSQSARLIQLHDVMLLAARLDAGDWEELLAPGADGRGPWWALPPLAMADRYFPGTIPSAVLGRLQSGCPLLLRRALRRQGLADVSLSKLMLAAFPGLEWSSSAGEALSFMLRRAFPDRETRAMTRRQVPAQAALAGSAWARLSQARKILQWLMARPPRVQAMYSIRRALAYRPS